MPLEPRAARIDDFEALAKDSNRRLNTRFDFPTERGMKTMPSHQPSTTGFTTLVGAPPPGETVSGRDLFTGLPITPDRTQVETPDTIAQRFAQGGVPPEQNLARHHFAPNVEFGVDALAAGPRAAFTPTPTVDTAAQIAAARVSPADIPDPTGVSVPAATPTAPRTAPQGFTLNDILTAVGPAETGFGNLALLGLGSSLVAQNEAQINARFGREQDIAEATRAEETAIADREYKAALGEQALATAEGTRFTTRQQRLGIPTGDKNRFSTTVIPADPISGTGPQIVRTQRGTGQVDVRPAEQGFEAAVQSQSRAGAIQAIEAIDAFKRDNPDFRNADDETVAAEILKRQSAGGS